MLRTSNIQISKWKYSTLDLGFIGSEGLDWSQHGQTLNLNPIN